MTASILAPNTPDYIRSLDERIANLERDRIPVAPSLDDLTNTNTSHAGALGDGAIARYRQASGLWVAEDFPTIPSVPSASGTVSSETTYGISAAAGSAATYSKGDHTHGSPSQTLAKSPAARSRCGILQSIATATDVPLTISNASPYYYDDGGFWASGNPTRLTAPVAGWYVVWGFVNWQISGTADADYYTIIRQSNTNNISQHATRWTTAMGIGHPESHQVSTITQMGAGSYVELVVNHSVGSTITVYDGYFALARVGALGYP